MPGLIGASMFSPRPARGYRFHSLHVEIIAPPRNFENYNYFRQIIQAKGFFALESECLTAKNHARKTILNHVIVVAAAGHRDRASFTAECGEVLQYCVFPASTHSPAHAPCPSRDRNSGGPTPRRLR